MTQPKPIVHQKVIDIEWGDMDALGHVNNIRYFAYFQQARIDWLATLNMDLNQPIGPVLVHIGCTYLLPVVYPAKLTINSSIHSIGRSSFVMDHDVYQGEQLMAQGASKIVWIDYNKKKSVSLPEEIRALFL